ncbi:unnamed protein product [Adineta ricciae]|uniref:Uncharacterized protein n=1 Tax=Adineta ricciae TaxID=249248 RepID=A0A814C653_ADIRI|nr:unnamed protein product [Adineta ricciae]CAF0936561.1 unnamed protein product [Adineta ricciae]
MNFLAFEPQSTSTPKKLDTSYRMLPNSCSTPRSSHVRYSLSKCAPLPINCSTPNTKKHQKSFTPDIHRLIYPTTSSNQIWIL